MLSVEVRILSVACSCRCQLAAAGRSLRGVNLGELVDVESQSLRHQNLAPASSDNKQQQLEAIVRAREIKGAWNSIERQRVTVGVCGGTQAPPNYMAFFSAGKAAHDS